MMDDAPRRVYCATLGCDKNLVDSEALLGRFLAHGFSAAAHRDEADVWVLNSCGFIAAARQDSDDATAELVRAKEADRLLVVTGCWAQEHAASIRERYPEVDIVGGVGQFDELVAAINTELEQRQGTCVPTSRAPIATSPLDARYVGMLDRILLTPSHVAFVKISEGCNCACTFCRIPLIRGKLRSRSIEEIVAEVRQLCERGVTEIQLVSQNTSDFGRDFRRDPGRDGDENLLSLVRQLDTITDLRRIRLLYLYAGLLPLETALRLLDIERVVPYLDLPIQHASRRMLKAMQRPGDAVAAEHFFATLRRERPDVVLRSTALLGFPGEEEEDVSALLDFLARVEFDHLGTYRYSPEAGTSAAGFVDTVPEEEVADREARVLDLQAEISLARQTGRLGHRFEVVIDAIYDRQEALGQGLSDVVETLGEGEWCEEREREALAGVLQGSEYLAVGRSYHFGYDLDGLVVLPGADLQPGQWVDAEFRGVTPFDTWAVAAPVSADRRSTS